MIKLNTLKSEAADNVDYHSNDLANKLLNTYLNSLVAIDEITTQDDEKLADNHTNVATSCYNFVEFCLEKQKFLAPIASIKKLFLFDMRYHKDYKLSLRSHISNYGLIGKIYAKNFWINIFNPKPFMGIKSNINDYKNLTKGYIFLVDSNWGLLCDSITELKSVPAETINWHYLQKHNNAAWRIGIAEKTKQSIIDLSLLKQAMSLIKC